MQLYISLPKYLTSSFSSITIKPLIMKQERSVQEHSYASMARIITEYRVLSKANVTFSLGQQLEIKSTDILNEAFSPHPFSSALKKTAMDFCEKYGIWLPESEHYITCAMYLFPGAPIFRILPIIKNNAIDFYLNDVMGREVFCQLTSENQKFYAEIKHRMSNLAECFQQHRNSHPVEIANLETLVEMEYISPASWFAEFIELYCYHIAIAHRDGNSIGMNYIQSLEEYINQRSHISGMPHTVKLIEFGYGTFLHREELDVSGVMEDFEAMNKIVSLIGCLMNDLFSFEKEVIDNRSDSNLISILMLNDAKLSLSEAIYSGCGVVKDLLMQYSSLFKRLSRVESDSDSASFLAFQEKLKIYLQGVKRCVQACWTWQVSSMRYKRVRSIWKETQLAEALPA